MDFNNNLKNSGKRKAQSIQDMITSSPSNGSGIRRSSYSGPKSLSTGPAMKQDVRGINVNRSDNYDRWGNSNEGMPQPKKPRYKADVSNPMRGNVLKRESEQSRERLDKKAKSIDREKRARVQQERQQYNSSRNGINRQGTQRQTGANKNYVAPSYRGPIDEFAWIILSGVLGFCVIVTLIASGVKPRGSGYSFPTQVITISGIVNTAYEHRMNVGGTSPGSSDSNGTDLSTNDQSTDQAGTDGTQEIVGDTKVVDLPDESSLNDLGAEGNAAVLDDGTLTTPGISPATSHSELVNQVKNEISNGNYSFVSAKVAYEDEATGQLTPYPMSVVKHFTEYMRSNPDKLTTFISMISSEDYSAVNGSAYIIKLKLVKFTIKMGESTPSFPLDNTVVSVSGFTDVIVNGNQNATIYPLLPCMYTVTLSNNAWPNTSQSQDIEAKLDEGNLDIKVGKASGE